MDTENISIEFKTKTPLSKKLFPIILAVVIILADQITKLLILNYFSQVPGQKVACSFFGDFLRIIFVTNPGIAFSIGQGLSLTARAILFRAIPLIVLILVLIVYFRNDDFTQLQRWAIMGVAGGGFGNLIDRCFRPEGVIDFVDVKFFGIFGMERWPTFNVADAAVVVCGIILLVSFIFSFKKQPSKE